MVLIDEMRIALPLVRADARLVRADAPQRTGTYVIVFDNARAPWPGICHWVWPSFVASGCGGGPPPVPLTGFAQGPEVHGGGLSRCDGVISRCIIFNNSSRWGAGLYDCHGAISNCRVTSNAADVEGGGVAFCHGLITNCIVSANISGNAGGGLYSCNGPIRSCLVSANRAALEGGGLSQCAGTIVNCTVVGNRLTYGGAVLGGAIADCTGDVRNSIFWDNGTPFAHSSTTPAYSVVPPGTALETGSFSQDPLFVTPGHWDADGYWIDGDYHLLPSSPAIDAGDPATRIVPADTDLDGRPRLIGDRVDLGAYETP